MDHGLHEFFDVNFNSKFLLQFAMKAVLKALSRFAFAAGKFPQAAEMRSGGALGNEELAGAKDETGGHFDARRRAHYRPTLL